MRVISFVIIILLCTHSLFAQFEDPKEITPEVLAKINADIDREIPALKQKMQERSFTKNQVEFSIDTFRIEEILSASIDIDYSTIGTSNSIDTRTTAYDKLLNKYYNKLMKVLQPEDKKDLIAAQKAWLVYRDAELKLIGTMTKDIYSGGGSMQSTIAAQAYSDIVVQRTIAIFNYYDQLNITE